jgi:glycosyltransferase involved in cell wall biosynthesis
MKICLVGVRGDGLLGEPVGGSERQIALLAMNFARRGHDVTLVTSEAGGDGVRVHGVKMLAAWDPDKGVRWLRAPIYRFPNLRRVLLSIGADLYYVRGAIPFSWVVAAAGNRIDSPVLMGLASDRDLDSDAGRVMFQLSGSGLPQRIASYLAWLAFQRRALHAADAVIAQNTGQAAICADMGIPHVLIPSIVEEPPMGLLSLRAAHDAIWMGNIHKDARRSKGLGELAQLAEASPAVRFAVVGVLTAGIIQGELARLRALNNVDLLGRLSYGDGQAAIARSRIVLNTSPAEGFSNVMLEGWALGKPALTLTVNPSKLLREGGLGWCAGGDLGEMTGMLRTLLADDARLAATGRRARDYVRAVHSADAVCERYEQLAAVAQ